MTSIHDAKEDAVIEITSLGGECTRLVVHVTHHRLISPDYKPYSIGLKKTRDDELDDVLSVIPKNPRDGIPLKKRWS